MVHGWCAPNSASVKPGGIPEYVALHLHRGLCRCGLHSPVLVVPKWIRKNYKTIKDQTADFLKQRPHLEVADTKTPAVSSDEKRLAAGISTTGLHTKKLTGAQRKKLIRERKMKERTWTEKPPRKNPPPQVKGRAGYSGGVKRPHSDSSTPSIDKQQPKNPGTLSADWDI